MQSKLKRTYSVKKEKSQKNTFSGFIEAKEFSRLADSVAQISKDVEISFNIFEGFSDAPEFQGDYKTSVSLQCQRCLDNFDFEISHKFHFYIGKDEDLGEDYSGYEYVETVDGDLLDIVSVIEDDILLNLPLIAKHETDCNEHLLTMNKQADVLEKETKKNPFAVLEGLKTSLKH